MSTKEWWLTAGLTGLFVHNLWQGDVADVLLVLFAVLPAWLEARA